MTVPQPRPLTQAEIAGTVRRLAVEAHETARARGYYHGGPRNIGESIALATRELGYAVNDVRRGRRLADIDLDARGKPRGFAVAVARCIVRLVDLCEYAGADVGKALALEMAYNASRVRRG